MSAVHVPVLLREVVRSLDLQPGLTVVDGTVGAGGHSHHILSRIRPGGRLIGLDRDPMMLALAADRLSGPDVELIHSSYRELRSVLDSLNIATVDRVLIDLGLSSDQLADRERGFGFDAGGPLDMRFDPSHGPSAAEWLNTAPEDELARALVDWGEVPQAGRLAASIAERRRHRPLQVTADLLELSEQSTRSRGGRSSKSPVAQVFQAVRIAVNEELRHLQSFLTDVLPVCLSPAGRLAVITFHSVEDRIVKQSLRREAGWQPTSRKPVEALPAEVRLNPRSRSARLRVALRATDFADRS